MLIYGLIFFQVYGCQQWVCEKLGKNICAEWNERSVKVNTEACEGGKKCYLMGLELEKNWKVAGTIECEDFDMIMETEPINCDAGKKHVSYFSNHPIRCYRDDQCKPGGKVKTCVCSMDGNGYCELAEGDIQVKGYKEQCRMLGKEEAFAWYLYFDLFPLLHSVPVCAQELFEDIKQLKKYSKMLSINEKEAFLL